MRPKKAQRLLIEILDTMERFAKEHDESFRLILNGIMKQRGNDCSRIFLMKAIDGCNRDLERVVDIGRAVTPRLLPKMGKEHDIPRLANLICLSGKRSAQAFIELRAKPSRILIVRHMFDCRENFFSCRFRWGSSWHQRIPRSRRLIYRCPEFTAQHHLVSALNAVFPYRLRVVSDEIIGLDSHDAEAALLVERELADA